MRKLFTDARSNAKTRKRLTAERIRAVILHFMPAALAGFGSVCAWSTAGCRAACLNVSGRGQVSGPLALSNLLRSPIHRARFDRVRLFFENRVEFFEGLDRELAALVRSAERSEFLPVARLNGTSDISWERFGVMERNPRVTFYDYTKSRRRAVEWAGGRMPTNYHLTYSATERDNAVDINAMLRGGINVAIPYRGAFPKTAFGFPVIDGTESDWRFRDSVGRVVALKASGRARRDSSGFVRG